MIIRNIWNIALQGHSVRNSAVSSAELVFVFSLYIRLFVTKTEYSKDPNKQTGRKIEKSLRATHFHLRKIIWLYEEYCTKKPTVTFQKVMLWHFLVYWTTVYCGFHVLKIIKSVYFWWNYWKKKSWHFGVFWKQCWLYIYWCIDACFL